MCRWEAAGNVWMPRGHHIQRREACRGDMQGAAGGATLRGHNTWVTACRGWHAGTSMQELACRGALHAGNGTQWGVPHAGLPSQGVCRAGMPLSKDPEGWAQSPRLHKQP